MPKLTHVQSSFSSGELSPYLRGRTSLQQYQNGCYTLSNMIVLPHGGITKRPGTKFIHEVKDSTKKTTLIPFIVGNEESYVMEFGHNYVQFYRNNGILLSTAAITNGTFATDLTGWTDGDTGTGASTFSSGTMRLNGGAAGVAIRTQAVSYVGISQYTLTFTVATNACTYRIGTTSGGTEIASGTGSVGSNSVSFTPTTDGTIYIQFRNANNNDSDIDNVALDNPIYRLYSPYTQDQVEEIQWAQTKDTVYLTHGDVSLRKIRRFGASQWDMVAVDLVDGPYYSKTDATYGGVGTDITITPSGLTGSITLTASAALFVSTDVGRPIRYRDSTSSEWSEITITAYTSPTQVTGQVQKVLTATTASKEWRLGYFSQTTGYPSRVAFHEQRLVLANTTHKPQSIWFSKAGDIEVFQPDNDTYKDEIDATVAMTYAIASRDTNDITWLSSRNGLFIGTIGSIFVAKASSLDEALTPDNISIKPVVKTAAHYAMPIETTGATLFIHYHQTRVLELAYSLDSDSIVASDLNILANHIALNRFKAVVRQEEPYNVLWGITESGDLVGLTYVKEQQVVGWHRHTIGGTDVSVKSIAVIPGDREDQLWMIVSRTIDGSTVQYVEVMTPYFRDDVDAEDAFFLDSGISYDGSSTDTLTGIDHLEGETVKAYADGYVGVIADPVTAGEVVLQEAASKAVVGLSYSAEFKGMPIHMETSAGTIVGSLVRGWKSFIRLHRSALIKAGYDSTDSNIVETFTDNYTMGGAVPLTTGIVEVPYDHGAELEISTYVIQEQPAPLTILAVGTKLVVDDDR